MCHQSKPFLYKTELPSFLSGFSLELMVTNSFTQLPTQVFEIKGSLPAHGSAFVTGCNLFCPSELHAGVLSCCRDSDH